VGGGQIKVSGAESGARRKETRREQLKKKTFYLFCSPGASSERGVGLNRAEVRLQEEDQSILTILGKGRKYSG